MSRYAKAIACLEKWMPSVSGIHSAWFEKSYPLGLRPKNSVIRKMTAAEIIKCELRKFIITSRSLFQNSGRVAHNNCVGWNISGDNRPCTDKGSFSDCYPANDSGI